MKLTASIAAAGIILSVALPASVMASTFGPLVTPEELASQLDTAEPIILDTRGDAYAEGHITGAVSAPYGLFRGPAHNPGQLVEAATLEERYEALGLNMEAPIVVVSAGKTDTDFGAAARVYWTLKSTGFTDLSILNGGMQAWNSADLPVDNIAVTPEPTTLDIVFSDEWTASTEAVVAVTEGKNDALLLDARTAPFFEGKKNHKAAARAGTLPGAKNHAYTKFFEEGSAAMSPIKNISSLEDALDLTPGQDVVSFCNTGHWAATNWFAMSEVAKLDNVKLYPGSMVEYSNDDAELEMANSPGLLKNFLNKAKGN